MRNGVGKTTTVRILATLSRADRGRAKVAGLDVARDRHLLRRRISLTGRPSVIFLDEPSTGLDPHSRLTMWQTIAGLAASGVTIFLTTQYLEEAGRLADRIAVLDAGRLVAEGTAAELKQRFAARRLDLTCPDPAAFARLSRYLGDRGAPGPGEPDRRRCDRRERGAGPGPARCRRSGPEPGRGLYRARGHPRRRFPHPDRTRNERPFMSNALTMTARSLRLSTRSPDALLTALVTAVAFGIGFRPDCSVAAFAAAVGVLLLFVAAVS
jgi:hypothetical protein